jgi:hypothetical protein
MNGLGVACDRDVWSSFLTRMVSARLVPAPWATTTIIIMDRNTSPSFVATN